MGTLLLALTPPGHVERMLNGLREELFRRHSLVSALALPALMPLGFLEPEGVAEVRSALRGLRSAFPAEADGYREEAGALFLGVDTGRRWARLREAVGRVRPLLPGFLPACEGFFLACREPGRADAAGILAGLPPAAIGRFTPQALCILEVGAGAEGPAPPAAGEAGAPWWRQVEWEEVLRLRLRTEPPGG